ncbi:MAG: peptidylprolyl isomerase [Clostridia bacterium]|nr:peptidylprolyl isomerase [Clostridia bacterium]
MKRLLALILCAAMLPALFACSENKELVSVSGGYVLVGDEQVVPEYVLEIDGEKVGFDRYRYLFLNVCDRMTENVAEDQLSAFWNAENVAAVKKEVEDTLLREYALKKYASEKKLTLTKAEEEEVDDLVARVIDNLGTDEFNKSMNTLYLTRQLYRSLEAEQKLFQKIYEYLFGENGDRALSDAEYKEMFKTKYICAEHILIDYEVGEDRNSCSATLVKAQTVLAEAQESFAAAMEKYSADEGYKDYPTGYYFTQDDVVSEFWNAASSLKPGEISQPVVTDEGVHIIRRLEPDEAQMNALKETVLWGKTTADGSFRPGVYSENFETFYKELGNRYSSKVRYNSRIEEYLKPGLIK